jgi:hypothetical protein
LYHGSPAFACGFGAARTTIRQTIMARHPATVAWTAFALAIMVAAGLGVWVWNERRANDVERARLDEARGSLQREEARARQLTDQMTALQQQMSALGDRVSGLEQSNRDLKKRLARARQTAAHTDVAALDLPSGPIVPEVEFLDSMPAVELHLAGEPGAPLTSLNLAPSSEWPVAERITIPRAGNPLTDPTTMKRMYITYGALQAADITTTLVGLSRGGYEANPLVRGFADKPAALMAVKVGTSVGTYFLVERLRKDKPLAAAITLAAINSTLAVVVVNNMQTAHAAKK